jgi:hypothetical protein
MSGRKFRASKPKLSKLARSLVEAYKAKALVMRKPPNQKIASLRTGPSNHDPSSGDNAVLVN